MSTVLIEVKVTGPLDQDDRRAIDAEIDKENARRAALEPPEPPLSKADNTARKESYEIIMAPPINAKHRASIAENREATLQELRPRWAAATDAQRLACLNQLPTV